MVAKLMVFVLVFFPSVLFGCQKSPTDPLEMMPEEVVESFYNWYLQNPHNPLSDRSYQDSPFLSLDMIEYVNQMLDEESRPEADPFLCAQDVPQELSVQPAEISGVTASVLVTGPLPEYEFTVNLSIDDHEWKIKQVVCRQ